VGIPAAVRVKSIARGCKLAFYAMSLTCPICAARMRTEPKKGKSVKYIDPEKYGLEP